MSNSSKLKSRLQSLRNVTRKLRSFIRAETSCHPFEDYTPVFAAMQEFQKKVPTDEAPQLTIAWQNLLHILRATTGMDQDGSVLQAAHEMRIEAEELYMALQVVKPDRTTTAVLPLGPTAQEVLKIIESLTKGQGMTGKEIIAELKKRKMSIKESSLRKHIIPKLKSYGIVNIPSAGGYCRH